jgi:hypothetical protein
MYASLGGGGDGAYCVVLLAFRLHVDLQRVCSALCR